MNAPELKDPAELIPWIVERCLRAAEPLEFRTFLVAVRAGRDAKQLPQAQVEAWKSALKRGVGLALAEAWEAGGRRCDFERPELVLTYDEQRQRVDRAIRPVLIYGRYRKLARELPQTQARWRCPECRGSGCAVCEGTGRRYPVALEDLLGAPAAAALGASAQAYTLHGMGREDVDVRCLGAGRPFVLQIDAPHRRSCNLDDLGRAIAAGAAGRAEVSALRWADDGLIARVKGHEAPKTYRALCALATPVAPERVADLRAALTGTTLEQRTPVRVARRRSDKVRRRQVLLFQPDAVEPDRFEAVIQAQSGTYIKELISGDEGRTSPSVTSLLGVDARCAALDVLEIHCEDADLLGAAD